MQNSRYSLAFIKPLGLFISLVLIFSSCQNDNTITTEPVDLKSVQDIKPLDSNLITPYDYKHIVSLKDLKVKEKKKKFIDLLLPSILIAKKRIEFKQNKLAKLMEKDSSRISKSDKTFLNDLLKKYKSKSLEELYAKLNTHPNSIVLAQSAIESGWGTSRFFVEANNTFGVWSFNKSDLRIKSSSSRQGKDIFLKKYSSLSESIEDYFLTLARGPYKEFRSHRETSNNPLELINYLYKYSETGEEYVRKLRVIIKKNNLDKYDQYTIDPEYLN